MQEEKWDEYELSYLETHTTNDPLSSMDPEAQEALEAPYSRQPGLNEDQVARITEDSLGHSPRYPHQRPQEQTLFPAKPAHSV